MDQTAGGFDAPKKKSGWLKWTLIGCGGLLAIFVVIAAIAIYFLSQNATMTFEPAKADTAAQEILQFENPEGYKGIVAGSFFGMKGAIVGAEGGSHPGAIILMSFPPSMSRELADQQMENAMPGQGRRVLKEQHPDETFKVRGEDVTAKVALTERDSKPLLEYNLVLKGTGGDSIVMLITGQESTTTHDWVQGVLSTVK